MKMNDLLAGAPVDVVELPEAANPFLHPDLLIGAQLTRIVADVMTGTVGVLFELRRAPRVAGSTALLRVAATAQLDWIRTAQVVGFTAWSLTGATAHQFDQEFQFLAHLSPAGTLRVVGTSAEFLLLDAFPAPLPTGGPADLRQLLRFGIADEDSDCLPVAVARSGAQA